MKRKKGMLVMLGLASVLLGHGGLIQAEEYQDVHAADDLAIHQESLEGSGALCGAIYLGYVAPGCESLAQDREYLEDLLQESGYSRDFNFLWNIPESCIAEVEGGMELYVIYPAEDTVSVSVNQYTIDEDTFEPAWVENLYFANSADPILLRCNATEIYWDAEVTITNADGCVLSWMPGMSLRDGRMEVPSAAPYVYDATSYALYESEESAYIRPQLISCDDIRNVGDEILTYSDGSLSVYASRVLQNVGGEVLQIGGFLDGEPKWGYVLYCPYVTELLLTEAFTSGTAQDPKIVLFNAEIGMMQIDFLTGECMWELGSEELMLGGGICFDVADDGTIYCGGYYDAGPTAISMTGEILWKSEPSEPSICRMYAMEEENGFLVVQYEADEGEKVVIFDLDGNVWQS